jgi:8-oxo-dGTP pyrophosphatase MutT (NUDIX family)
MIDAIRREVKEETNLEIDKIQFLFVSEGIDLLESKKKKHSIYLIHRCIATTDQVVLNQESQSYVWASLEGALALNLNSTSRATIQRLLGIDAT